MTTHHTQHAAPDDALRIARRSAKAKLGWLIHATIYVVVNAGLWGLALSQGKHWAIFPVLGWGLGLAIHGLAVVTTDLRHRLKEAFIQRELARMTGVHKPR